MNKPWQVILVFIGIFIAGGVAGGFVALRVLHDKYVNRPVPEEWAPRHLKRLNDRLDLTPEQQDQIRPIVRRHMEQLNRIRNRTVEETKTVVEDMQREVSNKLTPDQRTKFEQMNRELREARDARDKAERAKRDHPPGDGPPGEKPPPGKPPGN